MGVAYIPVARVGELEAGARKAVDLGGRRVFVTNVDGEHYAYSSQCPHEATELDDAEIKGTRLRCLAHSYCFDLRTGEADRFFAERLDRHGHQGDGDLLAGGQEHVHLACGRMLADFLGELDQFVGGVAAGADNDDDLVAGFLGADRFASGVHDALGVRHAAAAELLHDQRHLSSLRVRGGGRGA